MSDDSDRLHCKRKLPIAQAERPLYPRIWRAVDAEEAVKRGESVIISGRPGTGKSHQTRSIIQLQRDQGERVTVLAKKHLAAHNVGGAREALPSTTSPTEQSAGRRPPQAGSSSMKFLWSMPHVGHNCADLPSAASSGSW